MPRVVQIILIALACLVAVWLTYRTADHMYFTPRRDLLNTVGQVQSRLDRYAQARNDRKRLNSDLQNIVEHTLGGDVETVDHRLRTRLNRLAEHVGLANYSVGTAAPARKQSPVRSEFARPLRDEPDFMELPGWIGGQCSFEQALQLIGCLQAEAWIKRIDSLKLDPKDNGNKFDVNVRLTTLFVPGKFPAAELPQTFALPQLAAYSGFASTNPFRLPPAPAVAAKASPVSTPQGFAWDQWGLTGVAESAAGPEIWLLNHQTHESRRLLIGEKIDDAVFVAARGDAAEFTIGNDRFAVLVGRSLSDRSQITQ
jgi:hypothetical protein